MDILWKILGDSKTIIAVSSVIASTVSVFITSIVIERFKSSISRKNAEALESLKHIYAKDRKREEEAANLQTTEIQSLRNYILETRNAARQQVFPHLLNAATAVWKHTQEIYRVASSAFLLETLLTHEELHKGFEVENKHENLLSQLGPFQESDINVVLDLEEKEKLEDHRPFLPEKLWRSYYLYRQYCLRYYLQVTISYRKRDFSNLLKDEHLQKLIDENLTPDELQAADKLKKGKHKFYAEILQHRILNTIRLSAFGETIEPDAINELVAHFRTISTQPPTERL